MPMKICDLVKKIDEGRYVLPAMQRNFVWSEEKICRLFESIMRDYPIGTFLFWSIEKEMFQKYIFNDFIRFYDEKLGNMQRGSRSIASYSDYIAVLDGQQRITALYIGVKGKYRTHIKGKPWDKQESYIDKYLCINVMFVPNEEDEYQFSFQPEIKIGKYEKNEKGENEYWIRVSKVFEALDLDVVSDLIDEIPEENTIFPLSERKRARKTLTALYKGLIIVQNINYFLATDKTLTDVVDIFVRVNSGGQKLNSSDLMLSVAAGEQGDVDIHLKIQDAIEEINNVPQNIEDGFKVDKELLLTAGLLLTNAESLSLKNSCNYTSSRMNEIFKDHWDLIVDALKCSVDYIEYLGFVGKKLSRNIILPITYYFFKNQLSMSHKESMSKRACCDRVFIRQWLLRAMINGVFSDGTGTTLLSIRRILDRTLKQHFPLEELMGAEIKKTLKIENEQIEEMMELCYGDARIIPLFNELEHVAARQNDQVDHIWARSILSSKKKIKKLYPSITEEELKEYKLQLNKLANLQILDRLVNNEKSDTPFSEWLHVKYKDNIELELYLQSHFIPQMQTYDFQNLMSFFEKRRELLKKKIKEAFPSEFNELVVRYALQEKIEAYMCQNR